MVQTCAHCGRANPEEAIYCYHDGAVLVVGRPDEQPHPALWPFARPLDFPSGQSCRNFEQLLSRCQDEWSDATQMLRAGELERFFVSLGRIDLAVIARGAAAAQDLDRGLDELLGRLPCRKPRIPRLRVMTPTLDLGALRVGEDRRVEIALSNEGSRLIYGSLSSDCAWITPGDSPGSSQKVFQFSREQTLAVWVRGQQLRASRRTLEAQLSIESNAGSATVAIRATAPPQPFAHGVLSGASSPRQLVDKVRQDPRTAARLFEKGDVAEWYGRNGWPYPVPGPPAAGLNGVRQFFNALGLPGDFAAPALPFPEGVLAGATSPEQIVEKVRAAPFESAPLFENGDVATWYEQNDFAYPVQGPRAAGVDAVCQFLKASGIVDPFPTALSALPPNEPAAKCFAGSILADVCTVEELIQRVRSAPEASATLFESGAVAAWYESNGWLYPVQGPCAAGVDGVWQFLQVVEVVDALPIEALPLEALPLAPPSKSTRRGIHLRGKVGEQLRHVVSAKSRTGRAGPLSARATSDQPWLGIGETQLDEAKATIVLVIRAVPDRPGETLHARVRVTVNDMQSFVVPVTLVVGAREDVPAIRG
jgi:hypothetical protein